MKTVNDEIINDVMSNGLGEQVGFSFTNGHKFMGLLLDNTYKDPKTATSRELMTNAMESMVQAGRGDVPIFVHLPTMLEPWFSVKDTGLGLSREDVIKYFSGIGSSTKDECNFTTADGTPVSDTEYQAMSEQERESLIELTGGFGLGCKVPFTVADQYTITSIYDGMKYNFNAYKDERGVAKFAQMGHGERTDEHNGVEVRVPIKTDGVHEFETKFIKAIRYFQPKPEVNVEVEWDEPEYVMDGVGWGLRKHKREGGYYFVKKSRVVMGSLWYPIDTDQIREGYQDVFQSTLSSGIDIHLPVGSVDLVLSREELLYSEKTINTIRMKINEIVEEVRVTAQDVVNSCPDLWSAMEFQVTNEIAQQLKLKLEYDGQELSSVTLKVLPDHFKFYSVDSYRFNRYKTLSLLDYKQNRNVNNAVPVPFKPKTEWVVVSASAKRKPSRLLKYIKDEYEYEDTPHVFLLEYPDDELDKAIEWMEGVNSNVDIIDFDTEVPDIAVQRTAGIPAAKRKKLTKVKVMVDYSSWNRSDRDWWKDGPDDFDIDDNTGIWIDLKANRPKGMPFPLSSNRAVFDKVEKLKQYNLIPKDTPVYGCPANVKNKLKDHPNYLSLEDAITLANEIVRDKLSPSKLSKLVTARKVVNFLEKEDIPLDIDVKEGYYVKCSTYVDIFNRNKEDIYLVDYLLSDTKQDRTAKIDSIIERRFKADYPLACRTMHYSSWDDTKKEEVTEYIKMKSYIIEQGVKL